MEKEKNLSTQTEKKEWHKPVFTEMDINRETASAAGSGGDGWSSDTQNS